MVIILKKDDSLIYKSKNRFVSNIEIKKAELFDLKLTQSIKDIERFLLKKKILSPESKKIDPLLVWYIVGKKINSFIKKNKIAEEDEQTFWNQFYSRSTLIHKKISFKKISSTRNDFRIASLLAKFPLKIIKKVGPWAMWREILTYKLFLTDKRVLNWVINKLIEKHRTRDGARPFLKAVANRFKKIETTILTDKELFKKIKEIKIVEKN